MELSGVFKQLGEEKTGTGKNGNTWKSQTFAMSYMNASYDKEICFTAMKKEIIDRALSLRAGDKISVHFDVESRHWKDGKYFTDAKAYRIDIISSATATPPPPPPDQSDDLPF